MRLSKIKLSGFKSFVDPTAIQLPSNLVGVVGPNGCGKSNVIDAIRWVMGETSAKHLRGDSMADVIFNGSASRKPVGTATVELCFDNSDGSIGGQYASYSEVSLRRTVARDGTSQFFLNNVRCRRKDITAIFLGTGLGPRSYAIIEQGMISRLVEARPEEMRAHLEEAAGISKYKERRRETENRIRHTRDNLDRLNDLREEIENQLKNLQKQARAAERHRALKQELREVDGQLLAIRLRDTDTRIQSDQMSYERQRTEYEGAVAALRKIEAGIEQTRQQQILASDQLNATQARHYSVDLEISHFEHAIEHKRSTRESQQQDIEQAEQQLAALGVEIESDQVQLRELEEVLAKLAPDTDGAAQAAQASASGLREVESELRRWQEQWQVLLEELNRVQRGFEVDNAGIQHLQAQGEQLTRQRESLTTELGGISLDDLEERHALAVRRDADSTGAAEASARRITDLAGRIEAQRREEVSLGDTLDARKDELEGARTRLAALQALQQAALGQDRQGTADWLGAAGLADQLRLAQSLVVQSPWERAVETVLGDFLQAVSVDGIDQYVTNLPDSDLVLLDGGSSSTFSGSDRLLAKVSNAGAAADLLAGVHTADDLAGALRIRRELQSGESVITPGGVWLGPNWLRLSRRGEEAGGVLVREQEMRDLAAAVSRLESAIEELLNQRRDARRRIDELEVSREEAQKQHSQCTREQAEAVVVLAGIREEVQRSRQRLSLLNSDSQSLDVQLQQIEQRKREAQVRLTNSGDMLLTLERRRDELKGQQDELERTVEVRREQAERDRQALQEMTIELQARRSSRESASTTLERARSARGQFLERIQVLSAHLSAAAEPLAALEQQLQAQLSLKITVDEELRQKHHILEQANDSLREDDLRRINQDKAVARIRDDADVLKMAVREQEIRREAIVEQFAETGLVLAEVTAVLPAVAVVAEWEERSQKVNERIERIGTVNLLAIEEFEEQSERKKYLDSQHEDLASALETLESAIRKIDRETRARFQETFDNVNTGLQRIFPRLFGGGHAYLILEGDDLLEAGVSVMARPPGKRNSHIHLLSGGEKALTAVALVFAIFELNPAPFCLLDEVDAPLDDANVGRFCDIVREMSASVQFLFITHNKVTMEMAGQLTGVTMNEPGVSRLVSVDIDEAVKLVAS